jgi:ABC-2 type transport system permease protein
MHKILLIAKRDYLQTVLSKAYLFGLVVLPLICGIGFLGISFANREDGKTQRILVVDHTGISAATVIQSCQDSNRSSNSGAVGGLRGTPRFDYAEVKPDTDGAAQLVALADRIRRAEIFLVLDIPSEALSGEKPQVHYYSNATAVNQITLWLPAAVNDGLRRVRLAKLGLDPIRMNAALQDVPVVSMNLPSKEILTGKTVRSDRKNALQTEAMPLFLVVLMVMVVMVGAAPNLGAVAEDKVQRVFEMLLVSASSFELMMGKVLASLGASLTSTTFYIIGGVLALIGLSTFGLAPLNLLPWFFAYLIVDVLMMAALGVALGSACASAQDAQQLAFLLFAPIFVPMLLLTPILKEPNGFFATFLSFLPPFTPVLMLLRQGLPGGVPWWQPWIGLLGTIVYALGVIWVAARIFRIGILAQGKTPKLAELMQWVVRG